MKYNRLSLNYTKTTYFVCAPKCHSSSWENFTIKIGKHIIPFVESIKYLGVMIDKHLNWKAHIDYVIKKLSYAARILSIIRHYVNKQTLIKLRILQFCLSVSKVWNYFMGQCLSNFIGKDSSAAKQHHPYYELQICKT